MKEKIGNRFSYAVAQEKFGLLHPIAPTSTRLWYIFTALPYQIHDIARWYLFGDSSVKRIHIVYVYHVLVAYHLTGVQMGTFIGKMTKLFCFSREYSFRD